MLTEMLLNESLTVRPMNEGESKIFITICLLEAEKKVVPVFVDLFPVAVLYKRLEVAGYKDCVSVNLINFLGAISGSPGNAVMWAYTLACLYNRLKHKVNINDWVDCFPVGVPDDTSLKKAWESQKREKTKDFDTDNELDILENYPERMKEVVV